MAWLCTIAHGNPALCEPADRMSARHIPSLSDCDLVRACNAGIRSAAGSATTAEEPLQTVSAASDNIQARQATAPGKAVERSTEASAAASLPETTLTKEQVKQPKAAANCPKLFANAGHQVTSVIVKEDGEDDDMKRSAEQPTTTATPYDELD